MRGRLFARTFFLALVMACSSGCGNVAANSTQQNDPAQGPQPAQAAQLAQVFTLATSSPATYSTASGALVPMPSTSLTFAAQAPGLATISFSARGSVEPSGTQMIPIVFIECHIDGQPCQPDTNTVEFLYPQFCCDTRSFHWVAQNISAGTHTVEILWGMGNPTSAVVTNRSLIVETAATP
jgi:hypothetical protein